VAKIDKSLYSKEEFKRLKEQRRREKEQKRQQEALQDLSALGQQIEAGENHHPHNPLVKDQNYVLCLKHGDKYSSQYVNTLYSMVKRNLTIPFTMVCLTDNKQGIDKDVLCIDLPNDLSGWWCKPYMYSNELPLNGTILYMDLDVVISGNLNKLFDYEPNKWCVIRDFTRAMQPNWQKYNSSVIRFKRGQLDHVWRDFYKDPKKVTSSHFGDQDWLWTATNKANPATLWPDDWIRSWKWEIRKDRHLQGGVKGNRKFRIVEHVVPPPECCITVFHGDPNPHNCDDPWVRNNWT
jgi:hypothetical protein